jgi:hypothetical protein
MAPRRIRSRKTRSKGRKYSDRRPQFDLCEETIARTRRYGFVGRAVSGFDHYGYPIIRNMNLPAPFAVRQGRQYGAAESMIRPMRLVAVAPDGTPPPPKTAIATITAAKLKPSPSVPAAPADLPPQYKFCVQKGENGYFYRFRNAKTSLHGAEAEVLGCEPDETGMMICMVQMPGSSRPYQAPLCEEPGADKEPVPTDCCVKVLGDESGQMVCPGSAYDLLVVKIVTFASVGGVQIASVSHPDLPGGGVRLPVCEPIDEVPEERPCCIEEDSGLIVCPEGIDFPLDGKKIPLEFLVFATESDGRRVARLKCGDIMNIDPSARAADPTLDAMWSICEELGGYIFPVCERRPPVIRVPERPKRPPTKRPSPEIPPPSLPPKLPDLCCYDPQTGSLVCEGTQYHGLLVDVVAEAVVGGKPIVSVASDKLPGGGARVPLCPPPPEIPKLPPADCCVIESSAGLVLLCDPSDHPWNNKDVTQFGQCIDTPNGRMCVLKWADAYGEHVLEIPACPPPPPPRQPPGAEIPPAPSPQPIPRPQPAPRPEPVPRLPPPTRPPADGCETVEASRCRQLWNEMVARPAKMNECDKKWVQMLKNLQEQRFGPGRRASSMKNHKAAARRYGMGIAPENRQYARFPGLRGGREKI